MTFKTNLLPQTDSGWELGSSSLGWKITKINAPTTSGGSTYGPGSNGNVLTSNGSSVYWGSITAGVSGVKGNSESTYRTGDVNIAAADILGSTAIGSFGMPVYWNGTNFVTHSNYLTCGTAAGTAAKTITLSGFTLNTGTSVFVKFTNENTHATPTLNINSTGAKNIYYKGTRVVRRGITTGVIYHLIYDGTDWQMMNDIPPTVVTCSTGASTAAKVITCPGFIPYNGAKLQVIFTAQNTHATPTLNVNDMGAKPLICAGATTSNANRFGGTNHVYTIIYDGTNYRILQEDFRHYYKRGVTAVAATYYTQEDWDAYVAANGTEPTWAIGDQKTAAVAEVVGEERITLGNEITANTNNGLRGYLRLYGSNTNYTEIAVQTNGNRTFYLPNYNNSMYAVHAGSNDAVGSTSQPVYVAANGRITAITGAIANNTTGSAAKLTTAREIYVDLGTTRNTSSKVTFDGSADKAIHVSGTLPVSRGGTGLTTSTNVNAVLIGNATTATNAFRTIRTGSGAFYATAQDGAPSFGTLPIAQGGTGKTSATEAWTALGGGAIGKLSIDGSSSTKYLRGDGTWQNAPVTSIATKTGDVTLGTLTIGNATYNGSSNTTVSIADLGLASTTTFWGITSTAITDGSTTGTVNITIGPTTGNRTATSSDNGVVVMRADNGDEYIWTGNKWNAMGLASSYALAQHIHGNITNSGTITSTGVNLANNDRLLFSDSSNNGKIERSSITFDGSTTTKALTQKGTFENIFPVYHSNLDYTSVSPNIGAYPVNGQTHPVTGVTEYGSALSLPGISESSKHYGAQLVISSASGTSQPVHGYIRRLTSTPSWSGWSTLLDNNNFADYAVDRTGDTMSGGLTISTNDNPSIKLKNTDMDTTASSLSASEYSSLYFRDKNDSNIAYIQSAQISSDGHSYLQIASRALDTNNEAITNYFTLHTYKDGTRSVTISHPAAWRTGLNAQKQHSTIDSLTITFSNSTTATATATGVTSSNSVIVTPTPAQWTNWRDKGIRCTAQAADSLTFTADTAITLTTYANVMIFD